MRSEPSYTRVNSPTGQFATGKHLTIELTTLVLYGEAREVGKGWEGNSQCRFDRFLPASLEVTLNSSLFVRLQRKQLKCDSLSDNNNL